LASQLGWKFYDADDYHPAANIEKMHRGIPLTDEDRKPWLQTLAKLIDDAWDCGENIVLAYEFKARSGCLIGGRGGG